MWCESCVNSGLLKEWSFWCVFHKNFVLLNQVLIDHDDLSLVFEKLRNKVKWSKNSLVGNTDKYTKAKHVLEFRYDKNEHTDFWFTW